MLKPSNGLRERIYEHYQSGVMPSWKSLSEADYMRWYTACMYRIKGWLPLDKSAVCLDVGCGPGNVLYLLKKEGFQSIFGVDIAVEQVKLARSVGNSVEQADIRDYLSKFCSHFDLITAFDVIEHFNKREVFELLDLIHKALKPGGTLIIQTPNAESPWGMGIRYGDFSHELAFTPVSLSHVLEISRFDEMEVREACPPWNGMIRFARFLIWKGIRAALMVWNLSESGSVGSGIYTRVFLAKAQKPQKNG